MPLLDKNTLINNLNSIFHICLITVHSDMMKKLDKEFIQLDNPSFNNYTKSINIRQSIRKKILIEGDNLLKLDVHRLFVENLNVFNF